MSPSKSVRGSSPEEARADGPLTVRIAAMVFGAVLIAIGWATLTTALVGLGWSRALALGTGVGALMILPAATVRWLNNTPGTDLKISYGRFVCLWIALVTLGLAYLSPGAISRGLESGTRVLAAGSTAFPVARAAVESPGAAVVSATRSLEALVFGAEDAEVSGAGSESGAPEPASNDNDDGVAEGAATSNGEVTTAENPPRPEAMTTPGTNVLSSRAQVPLVRVGDGAAVAVVVNRRFAMQLTLDPAAVLTSIDRRALARAHVIGGDSAPSAGARSPGQAALLQTLTLGGIELDNVAIAVCDDCGAPGSEGVLGSNVLAAFDWAVDETGTVLEIEDRRLALDNSRDVEAFLDVEARRVDGSQTIVVSAVNRAPIGIAPLFMRLVLLGPEGDEVTAFTVRMPNVGPSGRVRSVVDVDSVAEFHSWRLEVQQALWQGSGRDR